MAKFSIGEMNSFVLAGEDLTDQECKFVKLTSAGIVVCDTEGEEVYGVLAQGGLAGEAVAVAKRVDYEVICGGSVTQGDDLMTSATGTAIVRTATNAVAGQAMENGVVDQALTISINPAKVLA